MAKTRPTYLQLHRVEELPADFALADDQLAAIEQICAGFAELTGYGLHYEAIAPRRDGNLIASFPVHGAGKLTLGELCLTRPVSIAAGANRQQAMRMAKSLAEVFSKLALVQQTLWQREAELATGVPVIPHREEAAQLAARLQAVLKSGALAVGCQSAALYVLDSDTSHLKLRSSFGLPVARLTDAARPLAGALADLEALLGHAVVLTDEPQLRQWHAPEPCRSAVCLPVSSATVPLGTVWFFCDVARDFSSKETELLEIVAGRLAAELERSALLTDAATSARQRQELAATKRLQEGQLPQVAPLSDNWDVAGWTATGERLIGAFHDWAALDRNALSVMLGEAIVEPSKGDADNSAAALIAFGLRSMVRASAWRSDPEAVLPEVNQLFWTMSPGDLAAALAFAVLDGQSGKIRVAAAARLGALTVSPRGTWRDCSRNSIPLGTDPNTCYLADEVNLAPGEVLLLLSPGLLEWLTTASSIAPLAGLAEALREEIHHKADRIAQATEQYLQSIPAVGNLKEPRGALVVVRRRSAGS